MAKLHLLSLVTTAVVFAAPASQAAEAGDPALGFHIINKQTNKCMHVHGGSRSDGGRITQWQCLYQSNVTWEIVRYSASNYGVYQLRAKNSGKCAATYPDNDVKQKTCANTADLSWELQHVGSGFFHLVSRQNQKCVAVKGGATADGTNIELATCAMDRNQLWQIKLVETPTLR